MTVSWATANGSARAGSDYLAASGSVTFQPGESVKTVQIAILGDTVVEPNETFSVRLSGAVGAAIATSAATITITNDDGQALVAAGGAREAGPDSARALTVAELDPVVAQAQAEWLAADAGADLSGVTVTIADLPGALLALTDGRTITVDATAAGSGWSVSYPDDPAARMDLRTVVLHELGHVLGLDHADEGLMAETLAVGQIQRVPVASQQTLRKAASRARIRPASRPTARKRAKTPAAARLALPLGRGWGIR